MNEKILKNIWIVLLIITLVSGYVYFFWTPQDFFPTRFQNRSQDKNFLKGPQENSTITSTPKPLEVPLGQVAKEKPQGTKNPQKYQLPPQSEVPVSLVVGNHSYSAILPGGSSVYDLMQIIRKNYPFTFNGKEYSGLGFFVEEINGTQSNTQEGIYWIYYINGKKAQVGISSYILKPNDSITWKYEHDEN